MAIACGGVAPSKESRPQEGQPAIAVGGSHTCALTSAAGVKCWGDNHWGELGDGTTTSRLTPVAVSGLASGVQAVAANGNYTCVLTRAGGVKCWGVNTYGELGDGTTTDRHTPVAVSGLTSGVNEIAVGEYHACALTSKGGVKCWGSNYGGELGDGTTTDRHTPVAVSGLASGVSAIAVGLYHTCVVASKGAVRCWGDNEVGELGDGTTTERHIPVAVPGLATGVTAIAAGDAHTCALTSPGGVECWGVNPSGEFGNGTTTDSSTPVAVSGLAGDVAAIVVSSSHTCTLTNEGGVECSGDNEEGQLGDGSTIERHIPVAVSGLASGVTAIAAGELNTCALTSAGAVECWGFNAVGELGDGTTVDSHKPVGVIGFGGSLKCGVPNVLGTPLAKARPEIGRDHCRVGTVTRVASQKKKNTVVGETPRPGVRLKNGARVNLKVSRGR